MATYAATRTRERFYPMTVRGYCRAYADLYRWSHRFRPVQWLWSAATLPDSRLNRELRDMRKSVDV